MYKNIEFEQIMKNGIDNYIFVDVRSPQEYEEAAVPGAINLPLFSNKERELVGTLYHKESIAKAKQVGVELVSKKLPEIYNAIEELTMERKQIVVYCARGGLRSGSLVSLFTTLGTNLFKLRGGYKSYRHYILEQLPIVNAPVNYIVLHGNTGVGKTEILWKLRDRGFDILDLEAHANHRGSLLGSVGLGKTRTQKQFEALIFNSLRSRKSDYVFVEAESKRIGNITVPDYIHDKMRAGTHIKLSADFDFRANLLTDEYTKLENCDEEILTALNNLERYIGKENKIRYHEMLAAKNYKELSIELMKKYYDPMYENEQNKYTFDLELKIEDIENSAAAIEEWWNSK